MPEPSIGGLPGRGDSARARKVIVVEDDALIAMDLDMALAERGWTVVGPAGNVARALTLLATESLAVALMDVNLGSDDSHEVVLALDRLGVPVVYLSGDASIARLAAETGRAWLSKPIDYDELDRVLSAAALA